MIDFFFVANFLVIITITTYVEVELNNVVYIFKNDVITTGMKNAGNW